MMTDALRAPSSPMRFSMDGLPPSARRSLVFVGLSLAALFIVGTTGCSGEAGNGSPSTANATGTTDATDEITEDVEDATPAPVVESLEATSTTVRPGASIELAVTAGRRDTDLEQSRQSLHADTGPHDGGRRDASTDETGATTPDEYCGSNRSGQLGDGPTSPEQTTPVAVQGIDSGRAGHRLGGRGSGGWR